MAALKLVRSFFIAGSFVALLIIGGGFTPSAFSAGPQVIVTWRAIDSSGPAYYSSKLLPGQSSAVTASVAVLSNGSLLDLSDQTISWYLDDNYMGGGVGRQTLTFASPSFTGIMNIRVEVEDSSGRTLINSSRIPMADPKTVIVAPYPGRFFSGTSVALRAEPYYLKKISINKLSFEWTVNGRAIDILANPQDLLINLNSAPAAGYTMSVAVSTKPIGDPYSAARSSLILTAAN